MLHGIRGVFSLREYPELLNVLSQETISNIGKLVFHRVANQDDALTLQFRNLALVRRQQQFTLCYRAIKLQATGGVEGLTTDDVVRKVEYCG